MEKVCAVIDNAGNERRKEPIPICRKYALSVEEASEYFSIGRGKLRSLINENRRANYLLKSGCQFLIKRKLFEQFLDDLDAV